MALENPTSSFQGLFRRIERLEQMITSPEVIGVAGDNQFETIILNPPGGGSPITLDTTIPGLATGITATPGSFGERSFVDVSWTSPVSPPAFGYQIEIAKKNIGLGTYSISEITQTIGNSVRFEGLEAGATYGVRVAGISRVGVMGAFTARTDFVASLDSTIPAQITGLTVFRGASSLIARWNASAEIDVKNGAGIYKIQIATDDTFTFNFQEQLVSATVAVFEGLDSQTTRYVRVAAIDSSGNQGTWSATVSATTGGITGGMVLTDAIVSSHIAAGQVTTGHMTVGTISGDRITTNTLVAEKIAAGTIASKTITIGAGGQFQIGTSPGGGGGSGQGAFLNSQGFSLYNAAGTRTVFLDAATGTATFTGTVSGSTVTGSVYQTAASGARIFIDTVLGGSGDGAFARIQFNTARVSDHFPGSVLAYYDSALSTSFLQVRGPMYASNNAIPIIRLGTKTGTTTDNIEIVASTVYVNATVFEVNATLKHYSANYENYGGTVLSKKAQNGDWTYRAFRTVGSDDNAGVSFHCQESGSAGIFYYSHPSLAFFAANSADSTGLFIWCDGIIDWSSATRKRSISDLDITIARKYRELKPRRYKYLDHPACTMCDEAGGRQPDCTACGGTGDARPQLAKDRANKFKVGLIAEEVALVYPDVVHYGPSGAPEGIEYSQFAAILLKVCQDLDTRLSALEPK